MMKAEVPAREPPPDYPADRCSTAPAVGVATTLTLTRVMEALNQRLRPIHVSLRHDNGGRSYDVPDGICRNTCSASRSDRATGDRPAIKRNEYSLFV
jgi:hypothetical protein